MPTLIHKKQLDEDKPDLRCDARCYDAQMRHCDCICEGMNHRVGFAGALRLTLEKFGLTKIPNGGVELRDERQISQTAGVSASD